VAPLPALLVATTVTVYAVPSVSPVMLHEVLEVGPHVLPPVPGETAVAVATYCTVPPPVPALPALQEMFKVAAVPLPTVRPVGAAGIVPTYFSAEAAELAESPTALPATTVTVYREPSATPDVMVQPGVTGVPVVMVQLPAVALVAALVAVAV
jgi:hypothetical protein